MARILLNTLVFLPDANSNAYIFADLARELKKLGHEITVLSTTPHYNIVKEDIEKQPMTPVRGDWLLKSDFEGIPCYHVRVPPVKGGISTRIKTALRFHGLGLYAGLGKDFRCDVVISQSPPVTTGIIGAWMAWKHGGKSVYIVQDIFPDGPISMGKIKNPVFIWALRLLEKMVYRQSDAITTIADGLYGKLTKRVFPPTLLRMIPNFVNDELYRPLPRQSEFSRERGLDDSFVVSYLGNLGHAQDFAPMMDAAEACSGLPFKFILAGGGVKQDELLAERNQRNLSNLEIWGYQQREATPWINAASDLCLVLLSPNMGKFSFPSKLYTIMACERPLLVYGDIDSDIARFVRENEIGWVVGTGDEKGFVETVKSLRENPAEMARRAANAVEMVRKNFTAVAVARQYDLLVKELLEKKKR